MKYTNRGFSLIEAMIAMAVMATGLLSVATFQTDMLTNSGTNKARAEALALAKVQIEGFRNYSTDVTDRAGFDAAYPQGTSADESITGTNATFTRRYIITGGDNAIKQIAVVVEWNDRRDEAQSVTLNTNIDWISPRAAADVIIENEEPLIPSATGRARLGDGTYTGSDDVANPDGTSILEDGDELKLIVGDDIVLTLKNACQSAGNCTDFVKISGRVYISTSQAPGEIYVKASDAAYCHRYYTVGGVTSDVLSTTTATQTPNTSGSDYEYFDYTCYLGGGWHGNIGIVFAGGISQSDKICVGDPTITDSADFRYPVMSTRRVYRGMLYKHDSTNSPNYKEEISTSGQPMVRYYTVGIADETILPASGDSGHNFVIASMAASDTTGDKCILDNGTNGPMMLDDSVVSGTRGQLFASMPNDFVCLNPSLVDTYDTSVYGVESTCPYDPSDPPSIRHIVNGTITIDGNSTASSDVALLTVNTSDGLGNCAFDNTSFTYNSTDTEYTNTYSCDVYDWGSGWTGFIETNSNSGEIYCGTPKLSYSAMQADTSAADFSCSAGHNVVIAGTVTTTGNRTLTATFTDSDGVADTSQGTCTNTAGSYSCNTFVFTDNDWSGYITFTPSAGYVCYPGSSVGVSPLTVQYVNKLPGIYDVPITIDANTSCN